MERGHRFIYRLLKAAESGDYEKGFSKTWIFKFEIFFWALVWLKKLQDEVLELQQQHVEANEALDRAYQKVNVLSSDAKHKSLKHLETAESLGKGWTTEQKGLMYGLGIVGGMFGGPIGGDENIFEKRRGLLRILSRRDWMCDRHISLDR